MRVLGFSRVVIMVGACAVAACGEGTDSIPDALGGTGGAPAGTGGSSGGDAGGVVDTGTPVAGAFRWLAIVDDDPAPVCTSTGPGADIDSVSLKRGGAEIGVGLTGSAMWVDAFPGTTTAACGMCMGMTACPNSGSAVVARIEGARDGRSYPNMPDTGYVSLNAGAVWIQIGGATGSGSAVDIKAGDTVTVNELDLTYKTENPSCTCAPEKYTVWAYVTMGDTTTRKKLTATTYRTANTACGALDAQVGCGTTDFLVP